MSKIIIYKGVKYTKVADEVTEVSELSTEQKSRLKTFIQEAKSTAKMFESSVTFMHFKGAPSYAATMAYDILVTRYSEFKQVSQTFKPRIKKIIESLRLCIDRMKKEKDDFYKRGYSKHFDARFSALQNLLQKAKQLETIFK